MMSYSRLFQITLPCLICLICLIFLPNLPNLPNDSKLPFDLITLLILILVKNYLGSL